MTTANITRTDNEHFYQIHLDDNDGTIIEMSAERFEAGEVPNVYALVICDEDGNPIAEFDFEDVRERDEFAEFYGTEIVNDDWMCGVERTAYEVDGRGHEYGQFVAKVDVRCGYAAEPQW